VICVLGFGRFWNLDVLARGVLLPLSQATRVYRTTQSERTKTRQSSLASKPFALFTLINSNSNGTSFGRPALNCRTTLPLRDRAHPLLTISFTTLEICVWGSRLKQKIQHGTSLHRDFLDNTAVTNANSGILQTFSAVVWLPTSFTLPPSRESSFSVTPATINTESISNQNGDHNHYAVKARSRLYARRRRRHMDTTGSGTSAKRKRTITDARCKC